MKPKPKTIKELESQASHESESEILLKFLKKYWEGLENVKPKGYTLKYQKNYNDFDGVDHWVDKEKGKQEDDFDGFDNGNDGSNFVRTVSLPHIAYNDMCQGRPPIQMLISACIAYGFDRGFLYGVQSGKSKTLHNINDILTKMLSDMIIKNYNNE